MRKGLFDRLEDIINQTRQENKSNPNEPDANQSVFDMILEKSKEILSDDDDEATAKRKIKDKVDEVATEKQGEAPTSVFDRVKDLILEEIDEDIRATSTNTKESKTIPSQKSIPNINIPHFNELTTEHKEKFAKFRQDKVEDIEKLIEKNKREEERLVARNERELERQIEWKNREEEELIERLLRKQERELKRQQRKT